MERGINTQAFGTSLSIWLLNSSQILGELLVQSFCYVHYKRIYATWTMWNRLYSSYYFKLVSSYPYGLACTSKEIWHTKFPYWYNVVALPSVTDHPNLSPGIAIDGAVWVEWALHPLVGSGWSRDLPEYSLQRLPHVLCIPSVHVTYIGGISLRVQVKKWEIGSGMHICH